MRYVIYHVESKCLYMSRSYATKAAAMSAQRHMPDPEEYKLTTERDYYDNIDYEYEGSKGYSVRASTPRCCDPNSDLYWSM